MQRVHMVAKTPEPMRPTTRAKMQKLGGRLGGGEWPRAERGQVPGPLLPHVEPALKRAPL